MSLDLQSPAGFSLLVLVGTVAGFINTLAGGGSLLTLPALMLLGLPADLANATNRVSVLAQSVTGTLAFDRAGRLDRSGMVAAVAPTLLGSFAGAWLASEVPPEVLEPVLVGGLFAVAVVLVTQPRPVSPEVRPVSEPVRRGPVAWAGLFAVGVYGGFLQAGVGFFLLAYFVRGLGYDLVRANALKVLAVAAFTAVALGVFVWQGLVLWGPGVVLALGTVLGAQLGVRFAVTTSPTLLRWVVLCVVIAAGVAVLVR